MSLNNPQGKKNWSDDSYKAKYLKNESQFQIPC